MKILFMTCLSENDLVIGICLYFSVNDISLFFLCFGLNLVLRVVGFRTEESRLPSECSLSQYVLKTFLKYPHC